MAGKLHKFVSRAPRYVFRADDRKAMRFSLENTQGESGIEHTMIVNLSETGLAFLVEPGFEPSMRERIKVEIPLPDGEQIAWWAQVVRVEEYEPSMWFSRSKQNPFLQEKKILVALKFESMPHGHARALRKGLEKAFIQAMREQQYRNWAYYRTLWLQFGLKTLIYLLLAVAAFGFIYWFSLPGGNYDAKRGTQWGDRFKF